MKTITFTLLLTVLSIFTLKAQLQTEYPEARIDATFVKVDTVYILYGGRQTSSKSAKALFLDSTYMFTHSGNNWEDLKPTTPPPGRSNHAAVSWNGKLYIIGGETANGLTNEIWEYNRATNHWTNVTPSSNNFTPRKNLAAVVIGNKLYIAGGEDASGNALNDAYVVDMNNFTSTQIANLPGGSPASIGAASANLNDNFYMFGGYNDYGSTNSNMHYNATTQAWDVDYTTNFYTGFAGIATINEIIALFWGGSSTSKNVMDNKLYSYNALTGEQTLISDNLPAGEYYYCGIADIDSTSKSTPDTVLYMWGGDVHQSFYKYSLSQDTVAHFDTIQGNFVTSINHENIISNNNISIYPNPAQDYIVIESKAKQTVKSIDILDISGKEMCIFEKPKIFKRLDISNLQKGVYFIKFNTTEGIITKKFIKE